MKKRSRKTGLNREKVQGRVRQQTCFRHTQAEKPLRPHFLKVALEPDQRPAKRYKRILRDIFNESHAFGSMETDKKRANRRVGAKQSDRNPKPWNKGGTAEIFRPLAFNSRGRFFIILGNIAQIHGRRQASGRAAIQTANIQIKKGEK